MSDSSWIAVERFLAREALHLDNRDWDSWLALYSEQAEYWVPAWADDGATTQDPSTEISLIYYPNRAGLEDRVQRVRSGTSAAANLETRTCHDFKLLAVNEQPDGRLSVRSNWQVHAYVARQVRVSFGWADYLLEPAAGGFQIVKKRTVLLNDIADTVMDFYLM